MILLTNEELDLMEGVDDILQGQDIALRQARKMYKWMQEECTEHEFVCSRYDCPGCWRTIEEELEL